MKMTKRMNKQLPTNKGSSGRTLQYNKGPMEAWWSTKTEEDDKENCSKHCNLCHPHPQSAEHGVLVYQEGSH
jgi:hypothetical protein